MCSSQLRTNARFWALSARQLLRLVTAQKHETNTCHGRFAAFEPVQTKRPIRFLRHWSKSRSNWIFFYVCIHSAAEWALAWPAPPAFSWSCHLLCPSFPLIRSLGMRQNHAQWLAWQSAFLQLSNDTQLAVLLPFDAKQRHFFSNKLTWPWRRLSVDCAPFLAIAPSSS